jgi:hypothetical protein
VGAGTDRRTANAHPSRLGFPRGILVEKYGIDANNEGYANSIVEWTTKWAPQRGVDDADLPDPAPELCEVRA